MPRHQQKKSERTRFTFTVADADVGAMFRTLAENVQDLEVHAVTDMPYHRNKPRAANGAAEPVTPALRRGDRISRAASVRDSILALIKKNHEIGMDDIKALVGGYGMPMQSTYSLLNRMKSASLIKTVGSGKGARYFLSKRGEGSVKRAAKAGAKPNGARKSSNPRFNETNSAMVLRLIREHGPLTGKQLGEYGKDEGRSPNGVQVGLPKMMRDKQITRDEETRAYSILKGE